MRICSVLAPSGCPREKCADIECNTICRDKRTSTTKLLGNGFFSCIPCPSIISFNCYTQSGWSATDAVMCDGKVRGRRRELQHFYHRCMWACRGETAVARAASANSAACLSPAVCLSNIFGDRKVPQLKRGVGGGHKGTVSQSAPPPLRCSVRSGPYALYTLRLCSVLQARFWGQLRDVFQFYACIGIRSCWIGHQELQELCERMGIVTSDAAKSGNKLTREGLQGLFYRALDVPAPPTAEVWKGERPGTGT